MPFKSLSISLIFALAVFTATLFNKPVVVVADTSSKTTASALSQQHPPVIDIAPILHPSSHSVESYQTAIMEIHEAMSQWGFFHAVNHGISFTLQETLLQEMQNFFMNTSLAQKETLSRNESNSRGYTNKELTKQKVDLKEILDIGPFSETIPSHVFTKLSTQGKADLQLDGFNNWPVIDNNSDSKNETHHLKNFRSTVEKFYEASYELSMKLLEALTSTISIDGDGDSSSSSSSSITTIHPRGSCLSSRSKDITNQFRNQMHSSFLRLNYYPIVNYSATTTTNGSEKEVAASNDGSSTVIQEQQPQEQQQQHKPLGISRHTDAGVLTVLLQHQSIPSQYKANNGSITRSALEVYTGSKQDNGDGEWVSVTPVPNAVTINGGDMLQVWSNNRFKAAEHRVQASHEEERFSAAFFLNPAYDTIVKPVEECADIAKDGSRLISLYQPIRWGTYRIHRFFGDYADVGEEIQIEEFKAADLPK